MEEKTTFREAYGVLQEHAQTLRDQTEPNIDELLKIVTESVRAYKVCKERIDAVEKALQEALTGAGVESTGRDAAAGSLGSDVQLGSEAAAVRPPRRPGASPAKVASSGDFNKMDDDIPF